MYNASFIDHGKRSTKLNCEVVNRQPKTSKQQQQQPNINKSAMLYTKLQQQKEKESEKK